MLVVSCGAGQYQNLTAQTSCLLATAGRYTANENDEQVDSAAIKLIDCESGTYSTGATGACSDADFGYYAIGPAQSNQIPCPTGRYTNMVGQTACILVTAGFFFTRP